MKNYTITPSKLIIGGFDLKNDAGNLVAITVGESEAKIFSLVPELLEVLDAFVREDERLCTSDGLHLQEKLKQYRK